MAIAALPLGVGLRAHEFWIAGTPASVPVGTPMTLTMSLREDRAVSAEPLTARDLDVGLAGPSGPSPIAQDLVFDPEGRVTAQFNAPEVPGLYAVGAALQSRVMTYSAQDFQNYLLRESLSSALAFRKALSEEASDAREVATMNAKGFVQVAGVRNQTPVQGAPRSGWTFELVPQGDPTALRAGDTLQVTAYLYRLPVSRVRLSAKRLDAPTDELPVMGTTNNAGEGYLVLAQPGRWLVRAAQIIPRGSGGGDTRWESYWSSLVIDVSPRVR